MNNSERRRIVQEAKMNGYQGSYVDLFREAERMPGAQQESMFTAVTPEQKEQGLRPLHEAGRTDASMTFSDVPPNTPFNTVGMKAPIDIKKYDKQGHLVKSYENVPPGIQNLDTGPNVGTVLETPSRMQKGGELRDAAMEMFPALEALGDVKVKTSRRFTSDKTGLGDIEYFAPGTKKVTYPTGKTFRHPGSNKKHAVLVNPDTNNAQSVALDLLHGLPAADSTYKKLRDDFGESLDQEDIQFFYEKYGLEGQGYDEFRSNYIDGKIRNLLFEGTPEDFENARYLEDKSKVVNPKAYEKFQPLKKYLNTSRKKAQEGTFASDNTRVSMPELQDQEAFNPYSYLHLPPSGRIDYSPVNVEDLLGVGQLIKPSRAVKRYFQKAADEGRNAGIAFRRAQAQKEAVIRNERIAQKIDEGVDIGYDDIYKPIRAEFQQKLDMGYTNVRATPSGEISRSLQNRFAPLSKGPVNRFKGDISRFLDYDIPRLYRAEQNLFKRKLQRKADDALDEMIKFDRESGTYLNQIENLYRPSKGGSKSTGSISGPSAKEKLADDFFDRNLDAPGTVQNKRGGYIKLKRKRYK